MKSFVDQHGLSQRRACELMSMSRSLYCYLSRKREDPSLLKTILEIKEKHPYFSQPRILAVLRRKGFVVNGKKVTRVLKTLDLNVKRKPKPKHSFRPPKGRIPESFEVGAVWAIDFVFDRLVTDTPFRCMTIVDTLSRQVPGILATHSMQGFLPVSYLDHLRTLTNLPRNLIVDNGPEFANRVFVDWCTQNGINLHFIDPGKPVQNAYIESFNSNFRKEFLSRHRFKSIFEVRRKLTKWIAYYNEERPHQSLDYLTPKEFAAGNKGVLSPSATKNILWH